MIETNTSGVFSADVMTARAELERATGCAHEWTAASFSFAVRVYGPSLWLTIEAGETRLALRALHDAMQASLTVNSVDASGRELVIDCASNAAAYRVKLSTHTGDSWTTVRCASSILPINDLLLGSRGRDFFVLPPDSQTREPAGRVYCSQDRFQTGALFGSVESPDALSFLYLQNFSTLGPYFEQTHTTPGGSVGGVWPELGFELPVNPSQQLHASNEYVLSDVYLSVRRGAPNTDGEAALLYLDALARNVSLLDAPEPAFHFWPAKATATVFDLSRSPLCHHEVDGRRYMAAYVGDQTKPPESMVQLTVLVGLLEYQAWSNEKLSLARELVDVLPSFFDEEIGCVVRWLPGARFSKREDEHQTHEAMDSWYLYHVLFNLARLAQQDIGRARTLFKKSLPYAIRVARRFGYRWPIFFNLKTLDIVQAQAAPGKGGENDVSGLYALVMLHAYQLFGDQLYLDEAIAAARALQGLGFQMLYQTNTTMFAAEAMLRLYLLTNDEHYLYLSYICVANLFNMMAIWERRYGHGREFSSFFGLYPLRGAPYTAAYEEAETLAKFFHFIELGGDVLADSVKRLMCEYGRHLLGRGWSYYPAELSTQTVASKSRNGHIARELAIPLEDLQDSNEQSGKVGQEIYGAGLALVCVTRYFHRVAKLPVLVFCEHPLFVQDGRFRVAGDTGSRCKLRVISTDPNVDPRAFAIRVGRAAVKDTRLTIEGHLEIDVRGGDVVSVVKHAKRRK